MPHKIFRVNDVEQAIELAQKFKDEGSFDLFRGQTHSWPPYSTIYRLQTKEAVAENTARIENFYSWLRHVGQISYLHDARYWDHVQAILQHYSVGTHLVDFSTDPAVAGFFSADGYKPDPGGDCCIYCLNSSEFTSLSDILKEIRKDGAIMEKIVVDVHNLWRLQAQRGVFIYANYNWDIDYPMDRIVFPYSGYPACPTKNTIYPPEKSALEHLLDQYFFLERGRAGFQRMMEIIDEQEGDSEMIHYIFNSNSSTPFQQEYFKKDLLEHPSWNIVDAAQWKSYPFEDYDNTVGEVIELNVSEQPEVDSIKDYIYFGIKNALNSNSSLRNKSIKWQLKRLKVSIDEDMFSYAATGIWNGMRTLPYTNAEIACAISHLFVLIARGAERMSYSEQIALSSELNGVSREVEFSNQDESYSKSIISEEIMLTAVREDISEFLDGEQQTCLRSITALLQVCPTARYLFDFSRFKVVFAEFVIPWQFVLSRDVKIFDCYHLQRFGLA
jgi:hypothetical protein